MTEFVRTRFGSRVSTFYSYKGGVGRTALLANVATLLASWGRKVLCLDWDLEAPGLKRYLADRLPDGPGVLDMLLESLDGKRSDWRALRQQLDGPWRGRGQLDFIDAGCHRSKRSAYIRAVLQLDFAAMAKRGLGKALEDLRREWLQEYDHVLIDSRTGITDVGGICTAQLPDLLVVCTNMNAQSMEGAADLVQRAQKVRSNLWIDRGRFQVLPVPCKVTVDLESALEEQWQERFIDHLGPHLQRALPDGCGRKELQTLFGYIRVPWTARWAHGEGLPVIAERIDTPGSTAWGIANIAMLVDTQLLHVGALLDRSNLGIPEGWPTSRGKLLEELSREADATGDRGAPLGALLAARAAIARGSRVPAALDDLIANREHLTGRFGPEKALRDALHPMLSPQQLDLETAQAAGARIAEGLRSDTPAAWAEAGAMFCQHWLAAGVPWSEANGSTFTVGTNPWNPDNPALPPVWSRAAELCQLLTEVDPERGWEQVRKLGTVQFAAADPSLPPALASILEGLLLRLTQRLPPADPPAPRAEAEGALLAAALQGWCSADTAAQVIAAHEAHPLFLAWRCAKDPMYSILDPAKAAEAVRREGPRAWWRAHVTGGRDRYLEAPAELVAALAALQLDARAVAAAIAGWPEATHSAALALSAGWAAAQPQPFAAILEGDLWHTLPAARREGLVRAAAGAEGPLRAALAEACAKARAEDPRARGLAADLARLLRAPAQVEDADTDALVLALELSTPAEEAAATLTRLAAHPGPRARAAVDRWASRGARAGALTPAQVRGLALQLTATPPGLGAIVSLRRLPSTGEGPAVACGQAVKQVIFEQLLAWIDLPQPLHAAGGARELDEGALDRLMAEAPAVWWRWAALLARPGSQSTDLVRGAAPAALQAALDAAPPRLERFSPEAATFDMLARALAPEHFERLVRQAVELGDLGQAERLLRARWVSPEQLPLLELLVEAHGSDPDPELYSWGRAMLSGNGHTGMRAIRPFAIPEGREGRDLSMAEIDPAGAALRTAMEARASQATTRTLRRYYAEVLSPT